LLLPSGEVLKDFRRESEARQALRLIQQLGLNQHGTVGTPAPVLEYWLHDGQAPHQMGHGLRLLPLASAGLRVEHINGQWYLRDPQRVLFNFGARVEDARQALTVLRKYGFTQVGVLGPGAPAMLVPLAPNGMALVGQGAVPPPTAITAEPGPGPAAGTAAAAAEQGALPAPAAPGTPATAGPSLPNGRVTSTGRHLDEPRFSRQAQPPPGAPPPVQPKGTPSPLAGIVTPAVPSLAPPGVRPAHKEQGFTWRTTPHFGPATGPNGVATAERVPFDWRQVQLRQEDGGWALQAGSLVLARFGASQFEARQALAAIRHYRFTEQWRIGGDKPSFTYFLASGQAPRGLMMGLSGQAFVPDALAVRQVQGHWSLCAGERVVVRLGQRQEEARNLLEVIKRNRFDRLCQLGVPGPDLQPVSVPTGEVPGLTFLVRSH
jgi:hypothetical protein